MVQPKIVFADEKSIDLLFRVAKEAKVNSKFVVVGNHPDFLSLNDLMAQQTKEEVDNFKHFEPEDPKRQVGALLFSSGTTGDQKGIMLSYDTLVKHRIDYMNIRSGMNALCYSTMSWITGTNLMTFCLRKRITRIIHDVFDVEETSKVIQKYKVNFMFVFPSVLTRLCKANVFDRYDFSSLDTIIVGGSIPSAAVFEKARKALPHTLVSNSFGKLTFVM